jgi:hypothetical protein
MGWGLGHSLGLLTLLGYLLFVAGTAILWRFRDDLNLWAQDEYGALRRGVARHVACAGAQSLREYERFKVFPGYFLPSLEESRRERITRGAVLLFAGPILFLLDYFV